MLAVPSFENSNSATMSWLLSANKLILRRTARFTTIPSSRLASAFPMPTRIWNQFWIQYPIHDKNTCTVCCRAFPPWKWKAFESCKNLELHCLKSSFPVEGAARIQPGHSCAVEFSHRDSESWTCRWNKLATRKRATERLCWPQLCYDKGIVLYESPNYNAINFMPNS